MFDDPAAAASSSGCAGASWTWGWHANALEIIVAAAKRGTVVTFLLHLGQKVFSWVIVKIIIYSLSNIIKYTMTRYFNYKNSNYHQEILQKTIQKILLGSTRVWTRDFQIVGPACYKRATQICYCREGFFMLLKNVPCAQKIFVLLTSQSWKPEKK